MMKYFLVALFVLFAACTQNTYIDPEDSEVIVRTQALDDDTIVIEEVVAPEDGWLVVYRDLNGRPGEVIGYGRVEQGTNNNVLIEVDPTRVTPQLYVMLHRDMGEVKIYEFPGPDSPYEVDGSVILVPFTVQTTAQTQQITGTGTVDTIDSTTVEDTTIAEDTENTEATNEPDVTMEDEATTEEDTLVSEDGRVFTVSLQNDEFVPAVVTIAQGDTVRWENEGTEIYSIISADADFDVELGPGEIYTHTFTEEGEFDYESPLNNGMEGRIIVTAEGSVEGSVAAEE